LLVLSQLDTVSFVGSELLFVFRAFKSAFILLLILLPALDQVSIFFVLKTRIEVRLAILRVSFDIHWSLVIEIRFWSKVSFLDDLVDFRDDILHNLSLFLTLTDQVLHEVTNGQGEVTNDGLVPSLEHVVIDGTGQLGAVQRVSR